LRANLSVLVPLAAIVVISWVGAFLPGSYIDEGPRWVLYPTYDAMVVVLAMLLPVRQSHRAHLHGYLAVALLILAASVFTDTVRPGTFSDIGDRAAGFAVNPNTAAFVMLALCSTIVSFDRIRTRDLALIAVTSIGVFATLSRGGGILLAFFLVAYTLRTGRARFHRLVLGLAGICIVGAGVVLAARSLASRSPMFMASSDSRFAMLFGGRRERGSPLNDNIRTEALTSALQHGAESPVMGHGTGFTYRLPVGPHNIYVQQWVNNGVLGLIAYVWLLLAAARLFRQRQSGSGMVFIGLVAIHGLFSHNVLEDRAFIALLGILLTMSYFAARRADVGAR